MTESGAHTKIKPTQQTGIAIAGHFRRPHPVIYSIPVSTVEFVSVREETHGEIS
jgi:hypothetical protein